MRRTYPIIVALILAGILACMCLMNGCGSKKETSQTKSNEELLNAPRVTQFYSDEDLKAFMDYCISEKNAHPGDETHWSRKILAIGLNEENHCLDVTVIDCEYEQLESVIENLKDYPANIHLTDHWVMKAGDSIVEEHTYIRHEDGTVEEYHYREHD